MLAFWGRYGALPQLTLELALSAERLKAGATVSISTSNELFDSYQHLARTLFPVVTFRSPVGAANVRTISRLRRQLTERMIADGTCAFVTLMPHLWSPFVASLLREAGVRHTVIVHDADPHWGDRTALVHGWLMRTAQLADHVVTLSRAVADRLIERGLVPKEKISVLFHPDLYNRDTQAGEVDRKSRPLRVLFFGRILPYKGLEVFSGAVETLAKAGTRIEVGVFGEGSLGADLQRLQNLNAEIVNKWIPPADVPGVFERYDVVVVTHREGSQSGVIAAAHGAGIPVICTPTGGLPEQIVQGLTGIVVPQVTSEAIASAIGSLVEDPKLIGKMKQGIFDTKKARSIDRFFVELAEIAQGSRQ